MKLLHALMVVACLGAAAVPAAAADKPNIILIVADDLGYGDLGCYGQKRIKTPRIDGMAADGMRFSDFYAGCTVCAPSRSTLLTGLHMGRTPVRGNPETAVGIDKGQGDPPLPAGITTFASLARGAGYATACIGKWGLGSPPGTGDPLKQGFEHHFGYLTHGAAHEYFPRALWKDDQKVDLDGKEYSHDLFATAALDYIREHQGGPFLLYFAPTIPHFKFEIPDLGDYADAGWSKSQETRAAMISRLDRDVGRILDLLKELKLDERTLVVFTSDNGASPEAGVELSFFDSNGPLRGGKRDMYEGGLRVPCIARWPGRVKPASSSDLAAAFWDVLPTIAELAGATAPKDIDGLSFAPTLLGKGQQAKHDWLYWEFQEQGGKQAVRLGDWKGIRLKVSERPDGPIELFDLSKDLGEKDNVAGAHADVVAKIAEIMRTAHTPSEHFPLLPNERGGDGKHKGKGKDKEDKEGADAQ